MLSNALHLDEHFANHFAIWSLLIKTEIEAKMIIQIFNWICMKPTLNFIAKVSIFKC